MQTVSNIFIHFYHMLTATSSLFVLQLPTLSLTLRGGTLDNDLAIIHRLESFFSLGELGNRAVLQNN